jgi:hypothetical protein
MRLMPFPRHWLSRFGVAALCLAFFLQGFFASRAKSPSNDESLHIMAGATYIATREIIVNPQHPPLLKELAGLSLAMAGIHWRNPANTPLEKLPAGWEWPAGNAFVAGLGVTRTLFWARLPLLLLSTLTGLLIYKWGRELAGTAAGLCALFLFAADPNMVAHSYLVTTDSGVTALSLLFLLLLFRYFQKPGIGRSAAAGVALGLALCAKFSAVFLLPVAGLLAAVWFWPPAMETGKEKKKRRTPPKKRSPPTSSALAETAVLIVAAIFVIQICYFSLNGPFLYLHGLSRVNADHRADYEAYLGGQMQHRFVSYFAAAWLLKEPLATVGLALGGVFLAFRNRGIPRLLKLFLFVPPCVFLLACTIWAEDIGIRYLMPAMPFGFIAGGLALAMLLERPKTSRVVAAVLCAWVTLAAAGIYPDHLSYFNEAACLPEHVRRIGLDGGSRCGSDWLADSNVDWGQSLPQLKTWLDRNVPGGTIRMKYFGTYPPEQYGIKFESIENTLPSPPPPGLYVVSSHNVAYWGLYNKFSWLRGEPDAVVGHTYSVFRF